MEVDGRRAGSSGNELERRLSKLSWVIVRCMMLPPRQGGQLTFYDGSAASVSAYASTQRQLA